MTEQETIRRTDKPRRDWIGVIIDVIALLPIAIAVFVGGILSFKRIMRMFPFLFSNWYIACLVPLFILGLDILWVVEMKKWQPISDQLKVLKKILSVIVLAFSASMLILVLGLLLFSFLFRNVWS